MTDQSEPIVYQQMKLTNGEEIIAQIVIWDEEDIVVKDALKITTNIFEAMDGNNGDPYNYYHYGLKPWMAYSMHGDNNISLSFSNIVGCCFPSELLQREYSVALSSIKQFNEEILESYKDFIKDKEEGEEEAEKEQKKTTRSNVFKLFDKKDDDTVH